MKKRIGAVALATMVFLAGIGLQIDTTSSHETFGATEANALGYAEQMDKNSILKVEITATPENWQHMLDNAINEEYIPADVTINGTTITNVGIRPKGNSSLSHVANNSESDRYSFRIKFDEYVDGQTWLGLDKLVLNSNFSDATSMKEYLSYDIMNYVGVNTPLYCYSDISVNGETWGFYLALEDVDSSYLDRTQNGKGELYKPESMQMNGANRIRIGGEDGQARPEMGAGIVDENGMTRPEMPMGENGAMPEAPAAPAMNGEQGQMPSPPEGMPEFGQDFAPPFDMTNMTEEELEEMRKQFENGGFPGGGMGGMSGSNGVSLIYTDDELSSYSAIFDNDKTKTNEEDHKLVVEALKNLNAGTDLETYVNVDAVLRYLAGHTVVVNLDSYSGNMAHNYVLHERGGRLSMLPWDYNMAFGGFMSRDASSVVNFPIDTPVSGVSMEDRPMISKLLEVPEYMETYHQYLQEIVDGYFSGGQFEQTVSKLDAMISDYIKNDPSAFFTYDKYQAAVAELKKLGTLRGESIEGQLNGTVPSTTEAQAANPEKLVDASSVDLSLLGDMGNGGIRVRERGQRQEGAPTNGAAPESPDGTANETAAANEVVK